MTRNIYIISDLHLSHRNMYNFVEADGFHVRKHQDNSPMTMEEGDELMIENWNKTVRDEDIVYNLGDCYVSEGHKHLWKLKGRKRLLLGNHDHGLDQNLHKVFEKIELVRMFKEFNCILSHMPLHESNLYKVQYNLHGHIHRKPNPSPVHINCSAEMMDYTPKNIEEIMQGKY